MPYKLSNEEAREIGRNHGYNAANYADAYSTSVPEFPARNSSPIMSDEEFDYYSSGWNDGVEQYANCMAETDSDAMLEIPGSYTNDTVGHGRT